MGEERPVTTGELAKALGLSRRSMVRYAAEGHITPAFTTPGGHHRWYVSGVKAELRKLAQGKREE